MSDEEIRRLVAQITTRLDDILARLPPPPYRPEPLPPARQVSDEEWSRLESERRGDIEWRPPTY
jgi:hypothetical protein